jgi:hypothetical protein
MLIYEPKKYPDLNPKIGDTVYDWITGKELGVVYEVGVSYFSYRDCNSYRHEYHKTGLLYYDDTYCYSVYDMPRYILSDFSIDESKRIKC